MFFIFYTNALVLVDLVEYCVKRKENCAVDAGHSISWQASAWSLITPTLHRNEKRRSPDYLYGRQSPPPWEARNELMSRLSLFWAELTSPKEAMATALVIHQKTDEQFTSATFQFLKNLCFRFRFYRTHLKKLNHCLLLNHSAYHSDI